MRFSRLRRSPSLVWIWLSRLGRTVRWFVPSSPRLVATLLVISLVFVGTWYAWRRAAPLVAVGDHYRLDPRSIEITPPPPWIRADICTEVVRDASLDSALSILDPALARRVADAFEFHPWVDQVVRVTKQAGPHVAVEIKYRKPVAMIDVEQHAAAGLVPVDAWGVRLPDADFSPQQKDRYPRISGIATLPLVGQAWDDPAAVGAAQLAAVLADVWYDLPLAVIRPTDRPEPALNPAPEDVHAGAHTDVTFEIITRGGTRILWGYAPRDAMGNEPSADEKLARLMRYASRHGGLETGGLETGNSGPTIDVRRLPATPRTAGSAPDPSTGDHGRH